MNQVRVRADARTWRSQMCYWVQEITKTGGPGYGRHIVLLAVSLVLHVRNDERLQVGLVAELAAPDLDVCRTLSPGSFSTIRA